MNSRSTTAINNPGGGRVVELALEKQEESSLAVEQSPHDNNLREKYTVEKEDDRAHIQQVSGGFGDSNNIDEETIKAIMKQQQLM